MMFTFGLTRYSHSGGPKSRVPSECPQSSWEAHFFRLHAEKDDCIRWRVGWSNHGAERLDGGSCMDCLEIRELGMDEVMAAESDDYGKLGVELHRRTGDCTEVE